MATTFKLIESKIISDTTTRYVSFTSIPQTYSDLCIRVQAKNTRTNGMNGYLYASFNSETFGAGTNQFFRGVEWTNSNGSSYQDSNYVTGFHLSTDWQTNPPTGFAEIYIMDYASTSYAKAIRFFGGNSSNSATTDSCGTQWSGQHWNDTSAISTVMIGTGATFYLKQNSTIQLYGIG